MRIITWNCRGLGNGPAIRGLLDVQKQEAPDILFLSETKHDGKWMEWLRWKLKMPNMVIVDNIGVSGGLALFWKREVNVTVKSLSDYCWHFLAPLLKIELLLLIAMAPEII
jgi:exonuclease III